MKPSRGLSEKNNFCIQSTMGVGDLGDGSSKKRK